jgi:hypothetical protein
MANAPPMHAPGPADLWALALHYPRIDPDDLAAAIDDAVRDGTVDFRTRLLIRDGVDALRRLWGDARTDAWLDHLSAGRAVRAAADSASGPPGFPSLIHRIMPTTKPDTVLQFLRELGLSLRQPTRIAIGGSVSLIVSQHLTRRTEDIDVVDELPAALRSERDLLDRLAARYGLRLAHFQSHYLPRGWDRRLRQLGRFGQLDVYLVDAMDVWLSKLFSVREKDRDDLRVLGPGLDRAALVERLRTDCGALRAEPLLRRHASDNWYIVFGEPLPE